VVPGTIERCLSTAALGLCVLAIDGLSYGVAQAALAHAWTRCLRSTFPSTSTTAWLTAVTGADPSRHGALGMVYRAPGADGVTHLISGETYAFGPCRPPENPLLRGGPTLFDRVVAAGGAAFVVGAELERLTGEWATALLHGARVVPSPAEKLDTDPVAVVERTVREVEAVLAEPHDVPPLVWAYVNLDDHIHLSGYDGRLHTSLRLLDTAASRWADAGWSVLAHADHGQVPVAPKVELLDAWDRLDSPVHCRMPGGGAGRVRWMYPLPGHEQELASLLSDVLADHALILTPDDLAERGLLAATTVVRERIGAVVAVATSAAFPVPDPTVAWEHGSLTDDEMLVPLAAWNATLLQDP
jgi:hypothetical protein